MNASEVRTQKDALNVERTRRDECSRFRLLGGYTDWRLRASDTGEKYFLMETVIPTGGGVPPHRHDVHEAFYVLEGSMEFARMGPEAMEWFPARPGDSVSVPRNQWHAFRNAGQTPCRLITTGDAALGHFFEEAGSPLAPGELPSGPPSHEEIQRVLDTARKWGHEFLPKP